MALTSNIRYAAKAESISDTGHDVVLPVFECRQLREIAVDIISFPLSSICKHLIVAKMVHLLGLPEDKEIELCDSLINNVDDKKTLKILKILREESEQGNCPEIPDSSI